LLRARLIVTALITLASLPLFADEAHVNAILGSWSGRAICTNRHAAPDCKEENVIFTIARTEAGDTVKLEVGRIAADGKLEPMYEAPLVYDSAKDNWGADIKDKKFKGHWSLSTFGGSLFGTLVDLKTNFGIRRVTLSR
jgi:hypothetical protein